MVAFFGGTGGTVGTVAYGTGKSLSEALFLHQLTHNMTTYCRLFHARISASEKDLPVAAS